MGLGAVWREGLLTQAVLLGRTKGWKNHPQLLRFKRHKEPVSAIGFYLLEIHHEANRRGYRYDKSKIRISDRNVEGIGLTKGQLVYEFGILKERLERRAPEKCKELLVLERNEELPRANPVFRVVEADVEDWEMSYWRRKGCLDFTSES